MRRSLPSSSLLFSQKTLISPISKPRRLHLPAPTFTVATFGGFSGTASKHLMFKTTGRFHFPFSSSTRKRSRFVAVVVRAKAGTDYYSTLNVSSNASMQEIKSSYRKQARKWSETRRLDLAGFMSSVFRAHLNAYDPFFRWLWDI